MMVLDFFRCDICKRFDERRLMLKRVGCVCGTRKFRPVLATKFEIALFLIQHPSYIFNALFGKE